MCMEVLFGINRLYIKQLVHKRTVRTEEQLNFWKYYFFLSFLYFIFILL